MARRRHNRRLLVHVLAMGCLAPCFPAAQAQAAHPPAHTRILGQYVAYPVHDLATRVTHPVYPGCKTLVKNFNQFRDVPFSSNNPRLSPRYPQFQRPHWTPLPWNRALAKAAETGCPGGICPAHDASSGKGIWANWLRQTKASRRAHQPMLWRTTVDLLGNGEHETIICLRAPFLGYVNGTPTSVPLPSSSSCPYIDSKLYMLPSPHPRMAQAFNGFMGWGWAHVPTDIIRNTLDRKYPYYILGWEASRPQTVLSRPQYGIRGAIGVTALIKTAPGDQRPYQYLSLGDIAWVPPVHVVTAGGHPWPRILYQGNKLSFACAQALPLAQSQFDSDHFYLHGPPSVPPAFPSALVLGPKPRDIPGGDGIAYDRKVFRKMTGPPAPGPVSYRIAFWQKQASHGRRLVLTDEYFNWEGDQYALLSISSDITPARFWAEFPGYNRLAAGPPAHGMTTVVAYNWRPPLVLSDKTSGRMWAVDVGDSWRWNIHPLDPSAALSPCIVRFHPRVTSAVSLLPSPVRRLAGLLDRALGPGGEHEGTLHPIAALRNDAQATWANVAMRPWALTREPYNTRAQVDANLRLWAKDAPLFQTIYDDIQRQYPLAERALARYYRVRFRKSVKEANTLAARALDIAFRSYFNFPSNDAGD